MRILSIVKIAAMPDMRQEVISILRSIRGPIQAMSGCLDCCIWEGDGDEGEIIFLEYWQSWEEFIHHIRSELYTRMLEAMELSRKEPEVLFFEVSTLRGMDLLKAVRNQIS